MTHRAGLPKLLHESYESHVCRGRWHVDGRYKVVELQFPWLVLVDTA